MRKDGKEVPSPFVYEGLQKLAKLVCESAFSNVFVLTCQKAVNLKSTSNGKSSDVTKKPHLYDTSGLFVIPIDSSIHC
jgi:hypothetical protein